MTREELKKHCQKQIENCEMWARYTGEKQPHGNVYEEHKLILELLEQEPCEDAVSRKAAIEAVVDLCKHYTPTKSVHHPHMDFVIEVLQDLPSVTPKQRTGKWVLIDKELSRYQCPKCGEIIRLYKKNEISYLDRDETINDYPFSHCGLDMRGGE